MKHLLAAAADARVLVRADGGVGGGLQILRHGEVELPAEAAGERAAEEHRVLAEEAALAGAGARGPGEQAVGQAAVEGVVAAAEDDLLALPAHALVAGRQAGDEVRRVALEVDRALAARKVLGWC